MATRTVTIRVQVHDLRDGSDLDPAVVQPGDYTIQTAINTGEPMYGMVDGFLNNCLLLWRHTPDWLKTWAGDDR